MLSVTSSFFTLFLIVALATTARGFSFAEPLLTGAGHDPALWETTKQAVQTFYDTVDKRGDIAPCFDLDVAEVVHNSNVYKGDAILNIFRQKADAATHQKTIQEVTATQQVDGIHVLVKGHVLRNGNAQDVNVYKAELVFNDQLKIKTLNSDV